MFRDSNRAKFYKDRETWFRRELNALEKPMWEGACSRIVVVRHGMGEHNDLGGALSLLKRDANLNDVGQEQARVTGDELRNAGYMSNPVDLVVVSPFTRTLETAAHLLAGDACRIPHVVQPLCAEHSTIGSEIKLGDQGNTPDTLRQRFPSKDYPQYDFSSVEQYCEEHRINVGKTPAEKNEWWRHGPSQYETPESFKQRAEDFRVWLGAECNKRMVNHCLVVTHGGFLRASFGEPKYHNCEYRVFDIKSDGSYRRVCDDKEMVGPAPVQAILDPKDIVLIAIKNIVYSETWFNVTFEMNAKTFCNAWSYSTIKDQLYKPLKTNMDKVKHTQLLGDNFPTVFFNEGKVKNYLHTVVAACAQPSFPPDLRDHVVKFFLRVEDVKKEPGGWASRVATLVTEQTSKLIDIVTE